MNNIFKDTPYSETAGSFIRNGNYPLEANYIFSSENSLKEFYSNEINATTIHKGLLKIVEDDGEGNQALYWVTEKNGELLFEKVIKDLDIENIETQLDILFNKVRDIIGTDDYSEIPEDLNSLIDLSIAITELREKVSTLKTELLTVVGTDEEDIVEYLKTLDYLNLTLVSETLHKFLDTIDETDTSINTLPELKEFLRGFEYTHNLYECFVDFWNNIQGTPTPNTLFRTLRGILDFVEALASISKNTDDNIQAELNQTQIGVGLDSSGLFSPDNETYYLKNATSVMNALRTLDSLVHTALSSFVINIANKDVVPLEITKTDSGYIIGASLDISNTDGNQLIKKTDGLYQSSLLSYDAGTITFKVNDNIISLFNIGVSSILKLGYYNAPNEELVLEFNTHEGTNQVVRIPVGNLIREWIIDNSVGTVELSKTDIVNGPDKLSADVRISSKAHNILKKDGNSLFVEGTSDAITYNNLTLTTVILDIISKVKATSDKLDEDILNIKDSNLDLLEKIDDKAPINSPIFTGTPQIETSPDDNDSSLKIPTTNWVNKKVELSFEDVNSKIYNNSDNIKTLTDLVNILLDMDEWYEEE